MAVIMRSMAHRKSELQIEHSHRAALNDVQTRFAEQSDHVREVDMAMAVQVRKKASPFPCGASEVYGEHAPARLQNPSYLAGALLARFAGQMMKHQCRQYSVELSVGKRQRLGSSNSEGNRDTGLSRLLVRPGNHLWRRVDPMH